MITTVEDNTADLTLNMAGMNLNSGEHGTTESSGSGSGSRDHRHESGPSDPLAVLAQTSYAQRTRALMDINDRLRHCGLDEFFSLPKIAAIGVQSSGKSSIIEAISEINVPRDSGTCTRCPMEVRLRGPDTKQWTCTVSLKFEHDVPETARDPCFPFATTHDKQDVEQILRFAQWMILNPNEEHRDYQTLINTHPDLPTTAEKFSKNSVIVDISGAPVDLTFIDLPGIVQASEEAVNPS